MKKFSFIGSSVLFALVVALLFWACQKEQQSTAPTDTPSGSEAAVIHGTSSNGPFVGK